MDQNDPLGNNTVGNITSPPTCCCKELIAAQDTKLKALSDKMETMLRMMTVQTALINVLVSGEKSPIRLAIKFPLKTEADLLEVEQMIGIEKDFYVEAIKLKLDGNILKNMEELIHRNIALMYNIDGTHGKKRFKDFVNLYSAIKASIPNGDKDETIRKAFQVVKKRHYRYISESKTKQHT
ncbi:uncharacterized protein LOC119672939 [Teleopsis dalmanni]|uniref:uncharacterized protein LOC119672939 n=1 Tax=Teleopsis dalmanni TaxID=139649 RepID=UPI0018CF7FDE|nr:uncharacterized protein LOC119672939 [Teleopsis dalmanni]